MGRVKKDLSGRAAELDIIRGLCILGMAVDHAFAMVIFMLPNIFQQSVATYDITKFAYSYWNSPFRMFIHILGLSLFLMLTGICCTFSRNNLKRGAKLFAVAMLFTLASVVIMLIVDSTDDIVSFGVLHCISVCLLIIGLLEKANTNKWVYLAIGVVMVVVGILFINLVNENRDYTVSYSSESLWTLIPKTIVGLAYTGADCEPLFPYGGIVFIGVFFGKWLYKDRKSLLFKRYYNNPVTFFGRNTLWFYLLHLLVIVPVWIVVYLILGARLTIF